MSLTFYGLISRVGDTVAAFIAGLDCGDYTVAADGSITVPYASDPDALCTAAYLINLANNPPATIATYGWGTMATRVSINGTYYTIPVAIGAVYDSKGQVIRPNVQNAGQNGMGLGKTRRLHMFSAYIVNAVKVYFGTDFTTMLATSFPGNGVPDYADLTSMFSGVYWDTISNSYDFNGQLAWKVTRPYPCTIAAASSFLHVADR